jgi:hypothetical protein
MNHNDLERISFVTRKFNSLQGLYRVRAGVTLLPYGLAPLVRAAPLRVQWRGAVRYRVRTNPCGRLRHPALARFEQGATHHEEDLHPHLAAS